MWIRRVAMRDQDLRYPPPQFLFQLRGRSLFPSSFPFFSLCVCLPFLPQRCVFVPLVVKKNISSFCFSLLPCLNMNSLFSCTVASFLTVITLALFFNAFMRASDSILSSVLLNIRLILLYSSKETLVCVWFVSCSSRFLLLEIFSFFRR